VFLDRRIGDRGRDQSKDADNRRQQVTKLHINSLTHVVLFLDVSGR
jgi:hypothetical protein